MVVDRWRNFELGPVWAPREQETPPPPLPLPRCSRRVLPTHVQLLKSTTISFSRKGKKYPTGTRANRATTMGFWNATGRDKPIHTKLNQTLIGMRKTLVFYQGRAPHGIKTDWIMHEFRLYDGSERPTHDGGWVVCRLFKKNKNLKMEMQQERAISYEEHMGALSPEAAGSPNVLPGDDQLTFLEKSSRVKFLVAVTARSWTTKNQSRDPSTTTYFENRSLSLPLGSWSSAEDTALRVIKEQADDVCFEDEMLRLGLYGIDHDRDCGGESFNDNIAGQECFNPKLQSTKSPK
uniref:NAC domain-containing protein n=1 Tax=Physcomitrium patens TaxID=3218 RepID=A0A2K1L3Z8_PHYPA|nr:hypothetical protein PHYPA_003551 [Physcomitrium patens]